MLLVNIMVFVIFPLLIVHKAVLNRNGYNEDVFTKKDTMAMRGIAACGIMFSHYVVALEELNFPVGPARFYEPVGGMGVCVFFFLSGYGLSASKRPMTLKFLTDRVKKIYLPYVAMRLLFGCLPKMDEISGGGYSLLDKSVPSGTKIGYILGVIDPHWFINVILLLYLLFFISQNISRKPVLVMFILTALASAGLWYMGFREGWYNANLVFVFGMLFYKKRTGFIKFMQRKYLLKIFGAFTGFLVFSLLFTTLKYGLLKTVAGCFLSVFCAGLLLKIRFQSPAMCFAGKRSMHWYVIHCMSSWKIAKLCFPKCGPALLFVLAVLFAAVITTVFYAAEQRVWKTARDWAGKRLPAG